MALLSFFFLVFFVCFCVVLLSAVGIQLGEIRPCTARRESIYQNISHYITKTKAKLPHFPNQCSL